MQFTKDYVSHLRNCKPKNKTTEAATFFGKAPNFSFENLCDIWKNSYYILDQGEDRGDYLRLRAWALNQLLTQAENSPSQLLQVADMTMHDINRIPITKRVTELLLKHFSEKEREIFKNKKYGTYDVILIARFLMETGKIPL